ncbi:MAG TPA: hypothetical protein VF865_03175 [Acidobacteriaceae bacterium]
MRGGRWSLVLVAGILSGACLAGCSQQDGVKAATTIHAYLPAVMGLANDASMMAEALDPAEASTLRAVSAKVLTELQELEAVSGAYVAAPSADGWSRLGAVVDLLVSDADEGLLAAMAIKNPESQARAKIVLSALDAAMHVVDGYMMSARSPQQAEAVAAKRVVHLQQVARCWTPQERQKVGQAYGVGSEDWPAVKAWAAEAKTSIAETPSATPLTRPGLGF